MPPAATRPASEATAAPRALATALILNAVNTVVEAVVGFASGSLALVADAGHNFSDVLALGLALGAVWLAARPATANRSFGYKRAEILAALANALTLVVIAVLIFVEAARRFSDLGIEQPRRRFEIASTHRHPRIRSRARRRTRTTAGTLRCKRLP
jgi:cation diffusion facilitator family transporter